MHFVQSSMVINSPFPPKKNRWTLHDYPKVVAIDNDVFAWQHTDEIFAFPELSAGLDTLHPLVKLEVPLIFNAGVMVVQPNMHTFATLVRAAVHFQVPPVFSWEPGAQSFLNYFFADQWLLLPLAYNVWAGSVDVAYLQYRKGKREPAGLKLVHYMDASYSPLPATVDDCAQELALYCKTCCRRAVVWRDAALARVG